ncbi:MAG: hypothetical protein SF053_01495 [Bacteroidia bacterium]|nr:hypothetical protein [Bacteroidia bacterium]
MYTKFFLALFLALALGLAGCYYDNEEELYPVLVGDPDPCDTATVTYATVIGPLLQTWCVSCHTGSSAGGNIRLSTYDEIKTQALNGSLYGVTAQLSGYSAMPKGGKLAACDIQRIKTWVDAGAPNN